MYEITNIMTILIKLLVLAVPLGLSAKPLIRIFKNYNKNENNENR